MSGLFAALLASALAAVVIVRCVCVLYHVHWRTHPRGRLHFMGFGYSYIALAAAAGYALVFIWTGAPGYVRPSVWLFLAASAGLILFDRRHRR